MIWSTGITELHLSITNSPTFMIWSTAWFEFRLQVATANHPFIITPIPQTVPSSPLSPRQRSQGRNGKFPPHQNHQPITNPTAPTTNAQPSNTSHSLISLSIDPQTSNSIHSPTPTSPTITTSSHN